jgi:hypothetical protein
MMATQKKEQPNHTVKDAIGQTLQSGSYVFFHTSIYQVVACGRPDHKGQGSIRIMLVNASKTTRPVAKYSRDMVLLEDEKIVTWKLTQGIVD